MHAMKETPKGMALKSVSQIEDDLAVLFIQGEEEVEVELRVEAVDEPQFYLDARKDFKQDVTITAVSKDPCFEVQRTFSFDYTTEFDAFRPKVDEYVKQEILSKKEEMKKVNFMKSHASREEDKKPREKRKWLIEDLKTWHVIAILALSLAMFLFGVIILMCCLRKPKEIEICRKRSRLVRASSDYIEC